MESRSGMCVRGVRLALAWAVVASFASSGCRGTPGKSPTASPTVMAPSVVVAWTADRTRTPRSIERHIRSVPNPGGTLVPWEPGFEFEPCTEQGEAWTTWFRYDDAGRLTEIVVDEFVPGAYEGGPHGGLVDPGTEHDGAPDSGTRYVRAGERLVRVEYWWTSGGRIKDPGKAFEFGYDGEGRVERVALEQGLGPTEFALHYDVQGRLERIDASDVESSATRWRMDFEYDADQRLVRRGWREPSGAREDHVFFHRHDGNLDRVRVRHVDAYGNESEDEFALHYDRAGRYVGVGDGRRLSYDRHGRPARWKGARQGAQGSSYAYLDCGA